MNQCHQGNNRKVATTCFARKYNRQAKIGRLNIKSNNEY